MLRELKCPGIPDAPSAGYVQHSYVRSYVGFFSFTRRCGGILALNTLCIRLDCVLHVLHSSLIFLFDLLLSLSYSLSLALSLSLYLYLYFYFSWLEAYVCDYRKRLVSLMGYSFSTLEAALAITLVDPDRYMRERKCERER